MENMMQSLLNSAKINACETTRIDLAPAMEISQGIPEQAFVTEGTNCSIEIKPSRNTRGKFLVVLKADIFGSIVKSVYATYKCDDDEIEAAKTTLVRSVLALKKIFKYNVTLTKNDEDVTKITFDWEKYKAFKETSSIPEFLPEANEDESCALSLKNPEALDEFASLLEEEWKETLALAQKNPLMKFEVKKFKGKFAYLSDKEPEIGGDFTKLINNYTSAEWMERTTEISSINRSIIAPFELEILEKVILSK
jgi:hypothetical protein